MGHWSFHVEFDPANWFGFVYRITDTINEREYIGKKFFRNTLRLKPLKGKKNRRKKISESNWREYTGSSTNVNGAIEELGKENFNFEIISLHETKGSLYYAEVYLQITEDVMRATLPNGNRKYYNGNVAAVKFKPPAETLNESQVNSRD